MKDDSFSELHRLPFEYFLQKNWKIGGSQFIQAIHVEINVLLVTLASGSNKLEKDGDFNDKILYVHIELF